MLDELAAYRVVLVPNMVPAVPPGSPRGTHRGPSRTKADVPGDRDDQRAPLAPPSGPRHARSSLNPRPSALRSQGRCRMPSRRRRARSARRPLPGGCRRMTDTGVTGGLGALDQRVERARKTPRPTLRRNPRATTSEPPSSDARAARRSRHPGRAGAASTATGQVRQPRLDGRRSVPFNRGPQLPRRKAGRSALPSWRRSRERAHDNAGGAGPHAPRSTCFARMPSVPLDPAPGSHGAEFELVRDSAVLSFAGLDAETLAEAASARSALTRTGTSRPGGSNPR